MKKFKFLSSFLAFSLCLIVLTCSVSAAETTAPNSVPAVIQPLSLLTGEEDISAAPSYDLIVPVATKTLTVPINVDYKGQLKIDLLGKETPKTVEVNLYTDEACTSNIGYTRYLDSYTQKDDIDVNVPAKGVYYLKLDLSKYAETDAAVTITPYSFSSEDKTLKNKVWLGSHSYSYDSEVNYKITVTTPGYISVEGASLDDYKSSIYTTLKNGKKEKLSDEISLSSYNNYSTFFAVKKGTYYVAARSSYDFKLRYTFTAVKEGSNPSKAKATVIGKGKTVKGLILSEDSINNADWYVVKLSKKQKLSLGVYAKSSDSIKFEIIPASSKVFLFGSTFRIYDNGGDVYSTKDDMPAGTYYIKVTKDEKTISGYYTIKLN